MSQDLIVLKVDKARALLIEAKDAKEAKKVADLARAAEVYARRQKLSEEAIQYATAVKIDAMTLMGEMLKKAEKNTGAKGIGTSAVPKGNHTPPTLSELGILKKDSSEAQALARIKEEAPEIHEAIRNGETTVAKARQATTPQKKSHKEEYPHSERLHRWMNMVEGETALIEHEGGIKTLLEEPEKWNWDDVNAFIIPILKDVVVTIGKYIKEINLASKSN